MRIDASHSALFPWGWLFTASYEKPSVRDPISSLKKKTNCLLLSMVGAQRQIAMHNIGNFMCKVDVLLCVLSLRSGRAHWSPDWSLAVMAKPVVTSLRTVGEELLCFFRKNCQLPARRLASKAGKELTENWCRGSRCIPTANVGGALGPQSCRYIGDGTP